MIKWFENVKISRKLITGFLLMAVIAGLIGGVGVLNITLMDRANRQMYEENALGVSYSGQAAEIFQRIRYETVHLSMLKTDTARNNLAAELSQYFDELESVLSSYRASMPEGEDPAQIDAIEKNWGTCRLYFEESIEHSLNRRGELAAAIILNNASITAERLRSQLDDLTEYNLAGAQEKYNSNHAVGIIATVAMVVAAAVGIALALILGTGISRMIGRPLVLLATAADSLAVGDTRTETVLDGRDLKLRRDEIGTLAQAFHRLTEGTDDQIEAAKRVSQGDLSVEVAVRSEQDGLGLGLSKLVEGLSRIAASILASADQVDSGARLVSDSSMSLSQGATEQASAVEELTASLEEIAAQTGRNARSAEEASALARNAMTHADAGTGRMQDMLQAMDEISLASGSISKIIKVIDDIAFQTNILALNAAVEAARAGQHGRGFAVVAQEVRTLAARSAQAAGETTELIERSVRKSEAGKRVAGEAAKALEEIVNGVEQTAALVDAIAAASQAQAAGIAQVKQGVTQVSQVVQATAATSEECAAASEELSGQSAQLKELISFFRIRSAGAPARLVGGETEAPELIPAQAEKEEAEEPAMTEAGGTKAHIALEEGEMGKY